jgi:3D (Asp-Asp-Asp) domain-containing protein
VADVLAELGVGLIGRDQTTPDLEQPLDDDAQIAVARARVSYEVVETALPYASNLVPREDLEIDQRAFISAGSPGALSQLWRVDTNGADMTSRTLVSEWVSRPPVDEVIGYGTNVVVRSLETPEGPISYWRVVRMRVTAYTAADAGKPRSHPAYGITASGLPAGFGIVAVDPNVVPFRSQVYVPGYGIGFAGDTGGGVKGRWIDLGYNEGEIEAWNGYVDVYYLTPVPETINYLIPTNLP